MPENSQAPRGARSGPAFGALAAPKVSFKDLTAVAQAVFDMERANTAGIHAPYETALAEKDYPAQVMLHWFISEQVEEEAWSEKLLVKTREATCAGGLSSLDRHLSKILFGDSEDSYIAPNNPDEAHHPRGHRFHRRV